MNRAKRIAVVVAVAGLSLLAQPGEAELASPHGQSDACSACHLDGSDGGVGVAKPIVENCLSCHPDADMHPVGMKPSEVFVPVEFPLEAGVVTCATCHAEPAHGGDAAKLPAPWHRGGPYEQPDGLCFRCHDAGEYERAAPHDPGAGRDPKQPSCTACHTKAPQEGAPPEAANLRLELDKACSTCHKGSVHVDLGHTGTKPEPGPTLASGLPLADGAIACFTCHEVHDDAPGQAQQALSKHPLAEPLRARASEMDWKGVEGELIWPGTQSSRSMLVLPLHDGQLCAACHPEMTP